MSRSSIAELPERDTARATFDYASVDEAFPPVTPMIEPMGSDVLIQLRQPKTVTKGGIELPAEVTETDKWNSQVGKVIAIGPLAFRNRDTGELWREGAWCHAGDFVRLKDRYGGDRWEQPHLYQRNMRPAGMPPLLRDYTEKVIFIMLRDLDLGGRIPNPGDALRIVAFI